MFLLFFLIFLSACAAAASTGMVFEPGLWYEELEKPKWNPPKWAFPVAWTFIYLCIAIAGARVAGSANSGLPLAFWSAQIALNTLWTPIFFGANKIRTALNVIVFMWVAVLGALITHWQVDTFAGLLFVPYFAWVSLATALNYTLVQLNPEASQD